MAQTIGDHGLYCPEFDNYAAVALYMQDLGTRIDDALAAQQDAINEFLDPPMILVTNSAAGTITAGASGFVDVVFDTLVKATSPIMTFDFTTARLHIGSPAGAGTLIPYSHGSYSAGLSCTMTAAGAVTVGSTRGIRITLNDDTAPLPPAGFIYQVLDQSLDMNTGGNEGLVAKMNFDLDGTSGVYLAPRFFSANLASNTTIPAGSAFMWAIFNGPTQIIEVA